MRSSAGPEKTEKKIGASEKNFVAEGESEAAAERQGEAVGQKGSWDKTKRQRAGSQRESTDSGRVRG